MTEQPLDAETLHQMRRIIHKRLQLEHHPLEVAAAEAQGFGYARHPNAVAAVDEALRELLREVGGLAPEPLMLEHEGGKLAAASEVEVGQALAYALRFDERGKHRSTSWGFIADMAERELAKRLEATGYVLMKRPNLAKQERSPNDGRKAWER